MSPAVERLLGSVVQLAQRERASGVMESLRAHSALWEQKAQVLIDEYGPVSGTAVRELYENVLAGPHTQRTRRGYEGLQRFDGRSPCSKCGEPISEAQWASMKLIGYQVIPPFENDPGEVLEMRNHSCGSTLAMLMAFTGEDVERGVIFELKHAGGDRKKAQQVVIENLKSDRYFYVRG